MHRLVPLLFCLCLDVHGAPAADPAAETRPNILWITAEDISPNLGSYGDPNARTPHLDRFVGSATRYTSAYSVHPCCSPSRSALATGIFPTRLGTFQHRGSVSVDGTMVRPFTSLLRAAGYYCFNGSRGSTSKTDYNFEPPPDAWDSLGSKEIEWRNRAAGQPFFGQLNLYATHQSQYGLRAPGSPSQARPEHRHDPASIKVPPYHPDTPAAREIWSEYHERLSLVDAQFQTLVDMLEDDGLLDDTIIFFFGDNGHGIPGGKIWLWDQGPHVPLLIRIPPKWRRPEHDMPGAVTDRLVSFVDFAPTVLALARVPVPDWMDGRVFLGASAAEPREYVHAARDFHDVADLDTSRMVRDGRFHYIRNFMPHLGWDAIDYSWQRAPYFLESWRRAAFSGKTGPAERQSAFFLRHKPVEELYDAARDPFNLHNLADDHAYAADLARLRAECRRWMLAAHDLGLLSRYELYRRTGAGTPYEMATDPARNPTAQLLEAADIANARDPAQLPALERILREEPDGAVRRWAGLGLLALGRKAAPAIPALERALDDASPDVRMTCAEALVALGKPDAALSTLRELLTHDSALIRADTLLALARLGPAALDLAADLDAAAGIGGGTARASYDNVPPLIHAARAAMLDPTPPLDGPLPAEVPMKARRLRK